MLIAHSTQTKIYPYQMQSSNTTSNDLCYSIQLYMYLNKWKW
jgi:hypothetical protein